MLRYLKLKSLWVQMKIGVSIASVGRPSKMSKNTIWFFEFFCGKTLYFGHISPCVASTQGPGCAPPLGLK